MADVNTVAASSPAQTEIPSLGSSLTSDIKAAWNKGEEPKKEETPKADPAPAAEITSAEEASATKEGESAESETVTAPEAGKSEQAPKRDNAETRKAQLNAEIRELLKKRDLLKAETSAPPTPKAESSPAKPEPQYTRPKPTTEDKNPDGTPKYATYEDYVEELSDWKTEQRLAQVEKERAQQAQAKELADKIAAAKGRYTNFDEAVRPAYHAIALDNDVSPVVKAMLNDSDVLPDLLFTLGSKPEELSSFVKMAKENPGKALRYIALTESLIHEELEAPKPKVEKPAETQTKAPKPPSEVGGRGAAPPDTEEAALAANDFRKLKSEWNRKLLAKLKS